MCLSAIEQVQQRKKNQIKMDSKFAFNKLLFVEMDRRNILLNRRTTSTSDSVHLDSSYFLSRFLSGAPKTKGSVSKCLFGRPDEGETKRLEDKMLHQERIRALNLYQFDIATQQPVNLTPPASPYIGHHSNTRPASDRVQETSESVQERVNSEGNENQTETVIAKDASEEVSERKELLDCVRINSTSTKRRSSEMVGDEEDIHSIDHLKELANKKIRRN